MKILVTELKDKALNYVIARLQNHQSRCGWMLEQQGYNQWQSYEQAWGNPIPDYVDDFNISMPLIIAAGINMRVHVVENGVVTSWVAEHSWPMTPSTAVTTLENSDYLSTALRFYIFTKLGMEIEIPDIIQLTI